MKLQYSPEAQIKAERRRFKARQKRAMQLGAVDWNLQKKAERLKNLGVQTCLSL